MNKYFSVFMLIALMFFSASVFASNGQPNGQNPQKSQEVIEQAIQNKTINSVKDMAVQLNKEQNVSDIEITKIKRILWWVKVVGVCDSNSIFTITGSHRKVKKALKFLQTM